MTGTLREAIERLAADLVYADVPTWVVDRVHDILAAHPAPDAEPERIVDLSGILASNALCAEADIRTAVYARKSVSDSELAAADAKFVGAVERIVVTYAPPSVPAGSEQPEVECDLSMWSDEGDKDIWIECDTHDWRENLGNIVTPTDADAAFTQHVQSVRAGSDELSDRAADAIVDLMLGDARLRGAGSDTADEPVVGCGARIPSPDPRISFVCSLPVLHDGPHSNEMPGTTSVPSTSGGMVETMTDPYRGSDTADERCHCGEPVIYGYDGDPTHHRGMCEHCDSVRCDAYPGECSEHQVQYDNGEWSREVIVEDAPAPADEREAEHVLTDFDGETYAALIDAAHQEQRQAVAADRSEETMTLFRHWSATAGWLAARKRSKDRTGEPDWPDAMVSAGSREREGEHVLTTNGMGYFWCSCDPHRLYVLWSLNEHIAEIADRSAAHDAALRARAEKAEQRLAQWRERMWVSVNERAVWMHEKGEHTGDLPYMPCPICEAGAAREAAAETRARAGRAANAVLARAASIARAGGPSMTDPLPDRLAQAMYARDWHSADSWATETSIIRDRYESYAEALLPLIEADAAKRESKAWREGYEYGWDADLGRAGLDHDPYKKEGE